MMTGVRCDRCLKHLTECERCHLTYCTECDYHRPHTLPVQFFLLTVEDDLTPDMQGPFSSEASRDRAAAVFRENDPDGHHGLYAVAAWFHKEQLRLDCCAFVPAYLDRLLKPRRRSIRDLKPKRRRRVS